MGIYSTFRSLASSETHDLGRDIWVLNTVRPTETLWPMENGLSTYAHRRHNPTRHSIAYSMSTPNEQREAVKALRREMPRLIEWPTENIDGIASPLRFYIVSDFIYTHYKPCSRDGYLEPAPAGWQGEANLAAAFRLGLEMGQLPFTWGVYRQKLLEGRVTDVQRIFPGGGEEEGNSRSRVLDSCLRAVSMSTSSRSNA